MSRAEDTTLNYAIGPVYKLCIQMQANCIKK